MGSPPKEVGEGRLKATGNANPMSSLRSKLKVADPEIQHYVEALEAENLKLQRQVGKMQAENTSLNNRMTILKEDTNDRCVHETPPYECLQCSIEEADEKLKRLEEEQKRLGKRLKKKNEITS